MNAGFLQHALADRCSPDDGARGGQFDRLQAVTGDRIHAWRKRRPDPEVEKRIAELETRVAQLEKR